MRSVYVVFAVSLLPAFYCSPVYAADFTQTNLVANNSTVQAQTGAQFVDSNLVDAWGMSFGPTTPIWVSDRATGLATVYTGAGVKAPISVAVPGAGGLSGGLNGPTGQVFAGGTSFDVTSNGMAANFIFDTLGGTVDAWNGPLGTTGTAAVEATTPGARYEGLALVNGANMLFAANFVSGGGIDVFNSSYANVTSTSFSGKFTDPNVPAGYAPFNVQELNGNLYVTYAKLSSTTPVPLPGGGGYVDIYDTSGNLLQHISSPMFDAPWGVAIAPSTWGSLAGALLVGNFSGNGEINAFDPSNGNWLATLTLSNGTPFSEPGLWAIAFGNGADSASPNSLYFTAGLNQGTDGLFGHIDPVPEPASWLLLGIGLAGLIALRSKLIAHS